MRHTRSTPLGSDGATMSRYRPGDARPFSVAFDWNRPGEPNKGGGGGPGFFARARHRRSLCSYPTPIPEQRLRNLRVRNRGVRVRVQPAGEFAPPRRPHYPPARAPSPDGRAGAAVLPRAYHVLDVIRYRGRPVRVHRLGASYRARLARSLSGSAARGRARLVALDLRSRLSLPWKNGVWRLTYLVRFRDRLYAGIQDYDGREPNDYLCFTPPPDAAVIRREDIHRFA